MIAAIITIAGLSTLFGLLLGYSAIRFRVEGDPIADQIDSLPQTQCGCAASPAAARMPRRRRRRGRNQPLPAWR